MWSTSKALAAWAGLIMTGGMLASWQPVLADDSAKVTGFWKLVSYVVEVQATGQIEPVMGSQPTGYVNFSPEGRVYVHPDGRGP